MFSPDGRRMATCGRDKHPILRDTSSWQQVAKLAGHDDEVEGIAFAPSGDLMATSSNDHTVRFWKAS